MRSHILINNKTQDLSVQLYFSNISTGIATEIEAMRPQKQEILGFRCQHNIQGGLASQAVTTKSHCIGARSSRNQNKKKKPEPTNIHGVKSNLTKCSHCFPSPRINSNDFHFHSIPSAEAQAVGELEKAATRARWFRAADPAHPFSLYRTSALRKTQSIDAQLSIWSVQAARRHRRIQPSRVCDTLNRAPRLASPRLVRALSDGAAPGEGMEQEARSSPAAHTVVAVAVAATVFFFIVVVIPVCPGKPLEPKPPSLPGQVSSLRTALDIVRLCFQVEREADNRSRGGGLHSARTRRYSRP
ncbi:hypothetical protein B0I35DRAFT_277464 [Stachybotrys elegans]|uniref:Uncharacterized protein n=1 Tax=Stachybotrys elegans TaxID=80388 RepID=A0A8K0SSC7_9HYPO|nr:hypothetical protein B0I35DRAFT_277464 [Stachybotrys elegans]